MISGRGSLVWDFVQISGLRTGRRKQEINYCELMFLKLTSFVFVSYPVQALRYITELVD